MSWECPECGAFVGDDDIQCVCGYRDEEYVENSNSGGEGQANTVSEPDATSRIAEDKRAKSIIKKIVIFFVAFNLLTYGSFIARQSLGRPHFVGKAFAASALLTSIVYVTPLRKIFGPESFVVAPFDGAKRFMLSLGREFIPEDDAEGVLHAYVIAKYEWDNYYITEFEKVAKGYGHTSPVVFLALTESLFSLLEPLSSMPVKDEKLRSKRLLHFLVAADRYIWLRNRTLEIIASSIENPPKQSLSNHPFVSSESEISRVQKILSMYASLKAFCKEKEKKAYELLVSRSHPAWIYESRMIYDATLWVNARKILVHESPCSGPEAKMFLDNRNILIKDVLSSVSTPEKHKRIIENEILKSSKVSIYSFVYTKIKKECLELD
ncbi:MAG: hypothetical protein OEY01_14030 [Desulfobulbaceae bacterium]|nr:hypothetical protein [Desulfobulbaceae bacterium]